MGQSSGSVIGAASHVWRRSEVKRVKVADRASVKHLAALETELFREHMPIVECLALLQYSDGSPRQTGFFGVYLDGATWVAFVKDKTGDAILKGTGRTLDEAVGVLSLMLGADDAPWEHDGKAKRLGERKAR